MCFSAAASFAGGAVLTAVASTVVWRIIREPNLADEATEHAARH